MVYDKELLEKNVRVEERKIADKLYTRTQVLDRIKKEILICKKSKKKNNKLLEYLQEEYRMLAEEEFAI